MSKKSKLNNKEKRLQEKRSRKASNKAKYAELRRLGINSKSKRFETSQRKKRKIGMIDHPLGNCGNIACKHCFPEMYQQRLKQIIC